MNGRTITSTNSKDGKSPNFERVILFGVIAALAFVQIRSSTKIVTDYSLDIGSQREQQVVVVDNQSNENKGSCLSLDLDDGDMDRLLKKYKQVLVNMPAKAAGTSYQDFSWKCQAAKDPNATLYGSFINILTNPSSLDHAYKNQLEVPTLIAGHMTDETLWRRLITHATKDTLIIYSHREETSRYIAGIKEVVNRNCKGGGTAKKKGFVPSAPKKGRKACHISEGTMNQLSEGFKTEIGNSGQKVLTCDAYKDIWGSRPNIVVSHYKQTEKMIKLLTKHHCPDFQDAASVSHGNMGSDKKPIYVVLEGKKNNGTLVPIDDWLDAKKHLMEFVTKHKQKATCTGTTRDMEDEMLACPDETLQISGLTYDNQRIRFPFQIYMPTYQNTA